MFRNTITRRSVLNVEALETREVQACTASVGSIFGGEFLTIIGDAGANNVQIFDKGDGSQDAIRVICDGVTQTFSGTIEDISLDLQGGNDKVTYTLQNDLEVNRDVFAELGDGNDTFSAIYQGDIKAVDHTLGARGDKGNDALSINALGANFSAGSNNNGIDIDAGANVNWRLTDGTFTGFSDDSFVILYNGELDGDLTVFMESRWGDDFLRLQAELDQGSTGNLNANILAGAGTDFVDARIRKNASADTVDVTVNVDGGLGNDEGTFEVPGTFTKSSITKVNQ